MLFGGNRLLVALLHRCLQCDGARSSINSYMSYAPIPPRTWLDAHRIYAFARERGLHQRAVGRRAGRTRRRSAPTCRRCCWRWRIPTASRRVSSTTVLRYVQEHSHWAKLTDVVPVHRMAKAVAIIPVGHDFPPFSASKGGSIEGSKIFLLAFDLAFQIQEQVRKLEAGGDVPARRRSRRRVAAAIPDPAEAAAAAMGDPAGAAVQPAALAGARRDVHRARRASGSTAAAGTTGVATPPTRLPPLMHCEVINHTPAGYALRQTDPQPGALRIGELIGLRVEGRAGPQVAMVRWFRNTLKGSGLEFGCEILSDQPEAAAAAAEDAGGSQSRPGHRAPRGAPASPARRRRCRRSSSPPALFGVDQGVALTRGRETGFAVLTKLIEQGPGFEIYDFAPVS